MSAKAENPQAFPVLVQQIGIESNIQDLLQANGGMSLRDYFAAAALTGLLSDSSMQEIMAKDANNMSGISTQERIDFIYHHNARLAYRHADEMLKARAA